MPMLVAWPQMVPKGGKDDKAQQIGVAMPQHRAQPAHAGHGNGGCYEIGDDDPLDAVGVGVERGHHLWEHHVDDGAVKQGDENADHHDAGGGPVRAGLECSSSGFIFCIPINSGVHPLLIGYALPLGAVREPPLH